MASRPARWLVTGCGGFIGSNLVERLLGLGQSVTGLDSFATGHRSNLENVRDCVGPEAFARFTLVEGDITDPKACAEACRGADYVLHQAALGSVPRSIDDPLLTNAVNAGGFLNMLVAARDAGVRRFVYASSSSVYGDHPGLPKVEERTGRQLSPYAVSKMANELYADVFGSCYGMQLAGLRYFNIFGPRQDPEGAYAAVIPKWFAALLAGETVFINGDGETSRDFCYVENAVRANLLAALSEHPEAPGKAYNVACGERTTLNELFVLIREIVARRRPEAADVAPVHRAERAGDVRHSLADISRARELLGYEPVVLVRPGMELAARWYFRAAGVEA
ncbi:SDR family oxidoreductase [Fundidesulfovibrio magnetotacticus]|nr:SDR family oxidoreductase [Fundidesulfovibrio magnetotacticus]